MKRPNPDEDTVFIKDIFSAALDKAVAFPSDVPSGNGRARMNEEEMAELLEAIRRLDIASNSGETQLRMDVPLSRFHLREVRPEQQVFRVSVFLACRGRCVISGCTVPEALEAAHLRGRDWRQGHNSRHDGILLRRDLHALYDSGLLDIDDRGIVRVAESAQQDYGCFDGLPLQSEQAVKKLSAKIWLVKVLAPLVLSARRSFRRSRHPSASISLWNCRRQSLDAIRHTRKRTFDPIAALPTEIKSN